MPLNNVKIGSYISVTTPLLTPNPMTQTTARLARNALKYHLHFCLWTFLLTVATSASWGVFIKIDTYEKTHYTSGLLKPWNFAATPYSCSSVSSCVCSPKPQDLPACSNMTTFNGPCVQQGGCGEADVKVCIFRRFTCYTVTWDAMGGPASQNCSQAHTASECIAYVRNRNYGKYGCWVTNDPSTAEPGDCSTKTTLTYVLGTVFSMLLIVLLGMFVVTLCSDYSESKRWVAMSSPESV